jgi:hypothetical protein
MPVESEVSWEQTRIAEFVVSLLSEATHVSDAELAVIRARMTPLFMWLDFGFQYDTFLYRVLDVAPRTRALASLLGDDFQQLYARLADSATISVDFDTMVNIDLALGRSPADASWAEAFTGLMPMWLEDDLTLDDVYSLQRIYEKVTNYLDPDYYDDELDWDARREAAEAAEAEQDGTGEDQDQDESWSSQSEESVNLESRQIDAMFDGLKDANR